MSKRIADNDSLFGSDDEDDQSIANIISSSKALQTQKQETSTAKPLDDLDAVTAVKKRTSLPSLNAGALLGPQGLSALEKRFESFKSTCTEKSGSEIDDLGRLLNIYRSWAEDLGVREGGSWPDFVDKLDRVKKAEIRKYMSHARNRDPSFVTTVIEVKHPITLPIPDNVESNTGKIAAKPFDAPILAPMPAPTLSDDLRRKIEEKRLEAMKRREEKQRALRETESRAIGFSQAQTQLVDTAASGEFMGAMTMVKQISDADQVNSVLPSNFSQLPTQPVSAHTQDNLQNGAETTNLIAETSMPKHEETSDGTQPQLPSGKRLETSDDFDDNAKRPRLDGVETVL